VNLLASCCDQLEMTAPPTPIAVIAKPRCSTGAFSYTGRLAVVTHATMFHVSLAAGPAILAVLVGAEGRPAKCALLAGRPFAVGNAAHAEA
jgi:hypothetical protein